MPVTGRPIGGVLGMRAFVRGRRYGSTDSLRHQWQCSPRRMGARVCRSFAVLANRGPCSPSESQALNGVGYSKPGVDTLLLAMGR